MPEPTHAPTNRPVHKICLKNLKAAVWQNPSENGPHYSVTFERLYKEGETWRSTSSFGERDMLMLSKLADPVHSWLAVIVLHEREVAPRKAPEEAPGLGMPSRAKSGLPPEA